MAGQYDNIRMSGDLSFSRDDEVLDEVLKVLVDLFNGLEGAVKQAKRV